MELYHEKIVTQVNALKTRAYYIPFTDENFSYNKSDSKEITLLNKWKFAFLPKFTKEAFDLSPTAVFDLPFNWQVKGFDYNQYTNFFYPFPYDPPKIDKDNPCGIYKTEYEVTDLDRKRYLVFDGVDSCVYLFVNGKFVGYSTVSHSQAEFDISDYLLSGKNVIKAVVLKWCSGSYFEDQDKLRMSGIFRDVYVISRPKDHLKDYKITTDTDLKDGYINFSCDKEANVKLFDGSEVLSEKKGKSLQFKIDNAKLWTSETPYLYRLVISYNGEYIEEYVGIRKITIENSVFKINGKPIKFKGVNRHSMTEEGYVESLEIMEKDLELFRRYNINAVRTAHYPPHPEFTKLCDKYGIYVLEEADIETHGLETIHYYGDARHFDDLANDPDYKDVYLHRQERMYERDKNRTSVVMWSLGNEAGWGENFKAASEYLHSVDSRPVHYEGNTTRLLPETEWRDEEYLDVASMMYPNVENCRKRIENGIGKPFVLCEYTHAMGNSCGDVKGYWDYIYAEERFVGGFVWEWCSHTVKDKDGNYLFGGDFNEKEPCSRYDGNFCVDGLVDTDRRCHPSLYEVGQVYAPVDVKRTADGFLIENRYDFLPLDGIQCFARLEKNGKVVEERSYDLSGTKARKSKSFKENFAEKSGYSTVIFDFYNQTDKIATRQIILSDDYPTEKLRGTARLNKSDHEVSARGERYSAVVGEDGMLRSLKGREELLVCPVNFALFRAPIDNDIPYLEEWQRLRLNYIRSSVDDIKTDGNKVMVKGKIVADIIEPLYDYELCYEFSGNGIGVRLQAVKRAWVTNVARFGFKITLKKEYEKCEYFARGGIENYPDRKQGLPVSLYNQRVWDMGFAYLKPQDNGERCDARSVSLLADKGKISVQSKSDFCFQATPFDIADYKRHPFEMQGESDKTVLFIDYKTTGVGSAACGSNIPIEFEVRDEVIDFVFDIVLDV